MEELYKKIKNKITCGESMMWKSLGNAQKVQISGWKKGLKGANKSWKKGSKGANKSWENGSKGANKSRKKGLKGANNSKKP